MVALLDRAKPGCRVLGGCVAAVGDMPFMRIAGGVKVFERMQVGGPGAISDPRVILSGRTRRDLPAHPPSPTTAVNYTRDQNS